jgi:hypothetical protein
MIWHVQSLRTKLYFMSEDDVVTLYSSVEDIKLADVQESTILSYEE